MSGVAPPHGQAEATNSNAARASTLAAAGLEVVSKLVSADVARLDALCSVKDCRSAPFFQGAFSGCRFRSSDKESGL